MSSQPKRAYVSKQRDAAAAATRARVLKAARSLFARRGIDAVTIAELAQKARVSASTVYSLFKSKEGVLRALMQGSLFGERYRAASARLDGVADPVEQIALTAGVARAIYESESAELGLMRGASAFSRALRKLEQTFEDMRFSMQKERIERLYAAITRLPVEYREALVLCELQELSYAEAAVVLDCPIGTVRSRLHRGKALLATLLDEAERPAPAPTAAGALRTREVCS